MIGSIQTNTAMDNAAKRLGTPPVSTRPQKVPGRKPLPPRTSDLKPSLENQTVGKKSAWQQGDPCPLDKLDEILSARTIMGEAERTAVVLWIAHSYVFDRGFAYTPRLLVTSSGPSCGKSALLRLIAKCSDGGVKLEKGTTLPVIRDLRKGGKRASLCLDQLDGTGRFDGDDTKLINLLCSAAEIGAKIGQKEEVVGKKGKRHENAVSDIGFPTALGKIGDLPGDAIMSRCIVVRMQPETEDERDQQMAERMKPLKGRRVQAKLRDWLAGLQASYTKAPRGTPSRTEDIWQPLFAVAKLAGPEWVARAERAIVELRECEGRQETPSLKLLRQVVDLTTEMEGAAITGPELQAKLGPEVSAVTRGKLLAALGLKARPGNERRYLFSDIQAAARRHLPERGVIGRPPA